MKTFTFSNFMCKPGSKLELIGMDGSFTMKFTVLNEEADEETDNKEAGGFKLDI